MIDERTLLRLGGIATVHQLRAAGASAEELTMAVRGGHLRRLRRGVYASPSAPSDVLAAVAARGRLSCVSAARSYGLWAGTDPRLHLQFSPHARAGPEGRPNPGGRTVPEPAEGRRVASQTAHDHVRHWLPTERGEQLWRVTIADCLRSVARCADEETAVAVFDTAISAGLTNPVMLRRILESQPMRVKARAVLARPGSDSGVESIVRQRLQALGHVVEQQVHVPGVGRVDMRVDAVLYLEIDGYEFHGGRVSFERDRARDAHLAAAGSARLRVSAAQVRDSWPSVLRSIEAVVAHSANSQDQRDQPGALACSIY